MIELGDRVRDRISGFQGIATSRTQWLNKCVRIGISPEELDSTGKPIEFHTFDEEQIEVVEKQVFKVDKEQTGGDRPNIQRETTPSRF